MKNKNIPLIVAILVGSVLVSGSMVFLGWQMWSKSSGNSQVDIEKGIEAYIQKKQGEADKAQAEASKQFSVVRGDYMAKAPAMGKKDAPVTLVEFSDFQCPYCGVFFKESYPQVKTDFIDTGKAYLVFRDYPLSFHENAKAAAMAAECAREQESDEGYFKYHDTLFKNQNSLANANLKQYAVDLGLKAASFNECLDGNKYESEVTGDFTYGQTVGISGTPGFLILMDKNPAKVDTLKGMEMIRQGQYIIQYIETEDGKKMGVRISGALPYETFQKAIQQGLN